MKNPLKKRGQKIIRRFSRTADKVQEEGKEHIKQNFVKRLSRIANIKILIVEWVLLVAALILLAITQSVWSGNSYTKNTYVSGGTYTEGTIGKVASLNPLFATTSSEKTLSRLLFSTLSTIDFAGQTGFGLAKNIVAKDDGKVWTVTIKDNLKWSDGEPITKEDVYFTARLIQNAAVSTIYDTNLAGVKVELGENEVVFTLPAAYADFVSALNFPILPEHILKDADPKTIVEHEFSTSPVTSGAFTVNAIQNANTEKAFYLSANPHYYKGKPMLNTFVVHTYADKASLISAMSAGSITATAELSAIDAESVDSNKFYKKDSSINYGVFAILNTTSNSLKNKDLRTAIRRGIDVNELRALVPNTTPLDFPLLTSQIQLNKYPEIPAQNIEAAKAKVAELKGEGKIMLNLVTTDTGYLPILAGTLTRQLQNLGFEVNLSIEPEGQDFITNTIPKRNYDILLYEIELGADPDLLTYYHSSQATSSGLNLSNYTNSLVDDALLAARETTNKELRTKKYETFLEYWTTDVPAIGIYQSNLTYFYNKNVRTFENDVRLVSPTDRFVDVSSWAVNKADKNQTP
ncbi:MAG: hypothetical protein K6G36_01150 [Candidatus Saccharibacteria bacterium]|nr:hypothetical protein [Candidatus Saccharibacteria bacterium]